MTARSAPPGHTAVFRTGFLYFLIIFAFAFVLGVARGLLIAPRLGEAIAVILEIPVLLIASCLVSRRLVHDGSFNLPQLCSIGAIAFVLTIVSEAGLAGAIRGQSLAQWLAALATPIGMVGLAGQIGFAMMPVFIGASSTKKA